MMRKLSNVEERITSHLTVSDGATTKDIAKDLSIGIGTASKYLEVLHVKGLVHQKRVGPSNYWTLPNTSEIFQNFHKFKDKLQMNNGNGLAFEGISFIFYPVSSFTELIENMIEKVGYEKAKEIFYLTAEKGGITIYDAVYSSTKLEGLALLRNILGFLKFLGYGKLEVGNNNMSSGQLTVIHFPPAEYKLKNVKNDTHFLTAGMLAGVASKITGLKLECTEIKCTAKGDPHCEYTTQPVLIRRIDRKIDGFSRKIEARNKARYGFR